MIEIHFWRQKNAIFTTLSNENIENKSVECNSECGGPSKAGSALATTVPKCVTFESLPQPNQVAGLACVLFL